MKAADIEKNKQASIKFIVLLNLVSCLLLDKMSAAFIDLYEF